MDNILNLPITTLSNLIRTGEVSPVELIGSTFAEIDRHNPRLNAFIALCREESFETAKQAEREIDAGQIRGTLHGIPVAVKDIIHVAGTPTTCGSKFFSVDPSQPDATVTARLKAAGAIIVGKTNLHEFAYGVTSENPHFGATPNPWDTSRVAGGSSGGSAAAIAACLCAGALGTDTGGLGSHSGCDVRGCRAETHLRTGQCQGRPRTRAIARLRRSDLPPCQGCRGHDECACGV